jgi:subtilisin family serine protease
MPSRRRLLFVLLVLCAIDAAVPRAQQRVAVPNAVAARTAAGEAVEVIVGVTAPFTPEAFLGARAADDQRTAIVRTLDDVMARARLAGVIVGDTFDGLPFFRATVTGAALDALAAMPGIASIEEIVVYRPSLLQSVPLVNAPAAWNAGATGTGWTVAVLDTGIEKAHPFLAGSVVAEACYSSLSSGVPLCPGGAVSSVAAGSGEACSGIPGCDHGTHVAGIAAGAAGPGGMNGVAPAANLISIKVFSQTFDDLTCRGAAPCIVASNADILNGLSRVLTLAGTGNANRIAAVNMSLGGGGFSDQAECDAANPSLKAAIDNLRSFGIATIIASGNDALADALASPGCISTAVSVGATTDVAPITVPSYSNDAPFLNLLAPGSGITSSVQGGGFGSRNGTSMAAPHVAGAWAVLKQAAPNAAVSTILGALVSTGTPVTDPGTGRTHPMINVNAARQALTGGGSPLPGAPIGLTASVTGTTLHLTWSVPVTGGAPTGYTLVARTTSNGPVIATVPLGNVTTFSAPVPSGTYVLSVVATNAAGAGPESNQVTVQIPVGVELPSPPTGLNVTVSGNTATFRWTLPTAGGAPDNLIFIAGLTPNFTSAIASITLPPSQTVLVLNSIPAGTYYARIYSRNGAGNSQFSSNEVVVVVGAGGVPGAPTLHAPIVNGTTVSLSWSAGAGPGPTSFLLTASLTPGGAPVASVPVTGSGIAIPGVAPGTYYLRLVAVNAAGTSPPSNEVVLVVP